MNKSLECVQINWGALGAKMANLTSGEQAEFFKSFCDEMNKYESIHVRDMQLFYIVDGCDPNDEPFTKEQKEVFKTLCYEDPNSTSE